MEKIDSLFYLQNYTMLKYQGCLGFHRVANAKENKLYDMREYNILGNSHVQSYGKPSALTLDRV